MSKYALVLMSIIVIFAAGCTGGRHQRSYAVVKNGHADQGKEMIVHYRCGSCHTIPGVKGAHGVFGPPLNALARRTYIAGMFPNKPEMLTHWIMSPQDMKPKTAMPDLGVSQQQARDMAAYLETLR